MVAGERLDGDLLGEAGGLARVRTRLSLHGDSSTAFPYLTILAMTGTQGDAEHNRDLDGTYLVPILRDTHQTPDRQAIS